MGKVYSLEQIHDGANSIPTTEDFETAIDNFTRASTRAIENDTIAGAVIYGSVATGRHTIRSDFDCMIVPYDHSDMSLAVVNSIVRATRGESPIDVSTIKHHRRRLESGTHEIDEYFAQHLTGPSRIVLGEDPAGYMKPADYGTYKELFRYIQHKKRSVTLGDGSSNAETYKAMQRALELPLAIGRKALIVLQEESGFPTVQFDSANKTQTAQLVINMFDSFGLGDVPYQLVSMDKAYTKLLTQTLLGKVSDAQYEEFLQEIQGYVPATSRWLDDINDTLDAHVREN